MTEIYDYLRVMFAKIGEPHCYKCGAPMMRKSNQEILDEISNLPDQTKVAILAKLKDTGKDAKETLRSISQIGYARARFNAKIMLVSEAMLGNFNQDINNTVEVVIDRILIKHKNPDTERILDSIETALKIGNGSIILAIEGEEDRAYNKDFICQNCLTKINEISPRSFPSTVRPKRSVYRRTPSDRGRDDRRHLPVHVAGTARWRGGRCSQRPLGAGLRAL